MPNTKSNEISHPNNFQSLPITRNRSKGTSKNEMTEKSQESSRIFSKLDKQITKQKDRNSKTPELHNIQIIKLPNKLLDASSQMPRSSENCTTRRFFDTILRECGCLPFNIRTSNKVSLSL